jgi:hypothetical protein
MSRGPGIVTGAQERLREQIAAINRVLEEIDGFDSAEVGLTAEGGLVIKSLRIRSRSTYDNTTPAASGAAIEDVASVDPTNIQEVAASQLALSNSYYGSVLAQARQSFRSAVAAASLGFVFFLAAIAIALVRSDLDASVISALGGAIVEAIAGLNFWLYSRTAAQLDSFHQRLERMQRFLLANSVCLNIQGDERATTMARLVSTISGIFDDPDPADNA